MPKSPQRVLARKFAVALAALAATTALGDSISPRALELYKNRQYDDAIKVLTAGVTGKAEADCGKQYLLLGECYFLTKQYDSARSYLAKAKKNCPEESDKLSAEFRLACVAYRAGEPTAADKINTFVGDHPADPRGGKLLVYRMNMLSAKGKAAEKEIEDTHEAINAQIKRYGSDASAEADDVLCDYYRKIGSPEKAETVYTRVAISLNRQITDKRRDKESVPASLERAYDNAALQLGVIYLDKQQRGEAIKWLESVRYDLEMKTKARLFLAKLAYEGGDFSGVAKYVGEKEFLNSLPTGAMRSDVYLVLGMAEKAGTSANPAKIEGYLREVGPESKGYAQAQLALGDMYREKGLSEAAIRVYRNAATNPAHAPDALYWIGALNMDLAAKDPARAKELYTQAGETFKTLVTKYPACPQIKQIKEKAVILTAKGVNVSFALEDDENVKNWEKMAAEKPGTAEGAQALAGLMRQSVKRIADVKTGKLTKAPDYVAAASAADRLLDEKVYTGAGLTSESWRAIQAEANYVRGKAELASVGQHDGEQGKFIKAPNPDRAADFFGKAQMWMDGKAADLVRAVELGLIEARFKSEKIEQRETALKNFTELSEKYGSDPTFQRLGLDIADWFRDQDRLPDAARLYGLVGDHAKETMPAEEQMKLWFTVGSLWSRAGQESLAKQNASTFTILVTPKDTVQLGDPFLRTHRPLQRSVDMKWPRGGQSLTAREALAAFSRATGIPFVWPATSATSALARNLELKMLALKDGPITGQALLGQIVDATCRAGLDIGLSDGTPTLATAGADPDDPTGGKYQAIELYDPRTAVSRYRPMATRWGEGVKIGEAGRRRSGRGSGLLLYSILERVESLTNTRITWAEGVDKQDKLAFELRAMDGINADSSCADVLEKSLDQAGLRCRLVKVDLAPQYFEHAKDAFNNVRGIDPKSTYGERALIAVALNFQSLKDFEKMKIVLREYLKVFDRATNEYYQQACFWVGWTFENENNFREATGYYARAAEERLVIAKPKQAETPLSREQLKGLLSNDSLVVLMEPVTGELKDAGVETLAEFVRAKGHVNVRVDSSAVTATEKYSPGAVAKKPTFDVLCDGLETLGLTFRMENINPEVAEKALYRMAAVYQRDGAMDQALESCGLLLNRYPNTSRRREAQTLMIDIYRGLKQYGKVMSTLEELVKSATDPQEKRKLAYDLATMHFDMADYAAAAEGFKECLSGSKDSGESQAARDAYAKALFRSGQLDMARAQFAELAKDEPAGVRKFTYDLLTFTLDELAGKANERDYPLDAQKFILAYEKLPESSRAKLTANDFARATWIYYTMGLIDAHHGRLDEADIKYQAVTNSPDEFIAGDAGVRIGLHHLDTKSYTKAREALEFLILSTRSSEANVRALYALGLCWEGLEKPERAAERYRQLMERYPLSPYVAQAKARLANEGAGPQTSTRAATAPVIPMEAH